jgi:hypothetical protein
MTTGILLIGIGHKNYGCMAANLAMSLRANGCDLPITLITQADTITRLDEDYKALFTEIKEIPPHCYTLNDNETCYIKAKAHMDELTPYDYTLFIDADVIMINNHKINEVIESLKGIDFAVKNSGFKNYDSDEITADSKQWANLLEVKDAFGFTTEKIWNVHSEFIWWKKGHPLFAKWVENFENIRVKNIEFAGCIPDELPLWIAMCQLGVDCHQEMYHPTFWPMDSTKTMRLKDLTDDYCGVSIGGNRISEVQLTIYNNLVQIHALRMNMRYKFLQQPKRRWAPERHTY